MGLSPGKRGLERVTGLFVLVLAACVSSPARAHDEVEIGVTAAGKLTFGGHLHLPLQIPRSLYPTLTGFSYGDLLLTAHAVPTEPGLLPVSPAAYLTVVLVSTDPRLAMYDSDAAVRVQAGQSLDLGYAPFSITPVFNLPPDSTVGSLVSAQFRLHDEFGYYADSDPFTLTFTAVPEPSALLIAPAAVIALCARPRRLCPARC